MDLGPLGSRCVQAAHPQQDGAFAFTLSDNMRAALRAEIPRLAGRRIKTPEQVLTSDPAKAVAGDVGDCREGRPMRFPAGPAVAMNDWPGIGVYFVGHVSAQAASSQHGVPHESDTRI